MQRQCQLQQHSAIFHLCLQQWIWRGWLQLHWYETLIFYFVSINNYIPDIDECSRGHTCAGNATCMNFDGGVNCTCLPGYFGDGDICIGMSSSVIFNSLYYDWPALLETDFCIGNNCSANAVCSNSHGSFRCDCLTGFEGNGYNCDGTFLINQIWIKDLKLIFLLLSDINECTRGYCSVNAECQNFNGSYSCDCLPGYNGDGVTCAGKYIILFINFV